MLFKKLSCPQEVITKFTWKSLYMQAFGPPEKATKTTGHGLILSSCTPKSNKDCASVKCIPNLMRWSFLIISINYRSCLTSYLKLIWVLIQLNLFLPKYGNQPQSWFLYQIKALQYLQKFNRNLSKYIWNLQTTN